MVPLEVNVNVCKNSKKVWNHIFDYNWNDLIDHKKKNGKGSVAQDAKKN